MTKDGKKLRLGYTTGSCATAAAKAAAQTLLTGIKKEQIRLMTPAGTELLLPVSYLAVQSNKVVCGIRKDSGDDPDVTDGALIVAEVSFSETAGVQIDGGRGVGRVTKRGLEQNIGEAAINSVPKKMIWNNVMEVCRLFDYTGGLSVIISVPDGEKLAKKTFNPRLGITGGISILGTTGIIEPMSDRALVDTIRVILRQHKENGAEYVLLTPGNYGAEYIRNHIPVSPDMAVMTSNFIGDALDFCGELQFKGALLVGHIGKLVKIAGGMFQTHSKYGDCRMELIAAHAAKEGVSTAISAEIMNCVTCEEAIQVLKQSTRCEAVLNSLTNKIGEMLKRRADGKFETGAVLFSRQDGLLSMTENAERLITYLTEE